MDAQPARSLAQRRHDAVEQLSRPHADAWVSTWSAQDGGHLVPLSAAWTGDRVVLITERRSRTSVNLSASRRARLGYGHTRDVVLIDAEVARLGALDGELAPLVEAFADQSDWDPRGEQDLSVWTVVELRPIRIQAWRESNEIAGRTIMRDGAWLADDR